MKFRVAQQHGLSNAHSPFRVVYQTGREVEWINRYLDQERVRGVADSTLRSYAHGLLHFLRWWAATHRTAAITQQALTESTFLDYIRFQVDQNPPPAAQSVNRRVGTAERAMRREFPDAPRLFEPGFQNWYWRHSRLGYGRSRPALTHDHPNIVRIVSKRLAYAPYWYAMQPYESSRFDKLSDIVGNHERVYTVFRSILDAIRYAHSEGIIHRNLKPENVLINSVSARRQGRTIWWGVPSTWSLIPMPTAAAGKQPYNCRAACGPQESLCTT